MRTHMVCIVCHKRGSNFKWPSTDELGKVTPLKSNLNHCTFTLFIHLARTANYEKSIKEQRLSWYNRVSTKHFKVINFEGLLIFDLSPLPVANEQGCKHVICNWWMTNLYFAFFIEVGCLYMYISCIKCNVLL